MNISTLKEKLGDETFSELEAHINGLVSQRDAAKKESIDGRKSLKARVVELESAQSNLLDKLGLASLDDLEGIPDAKGQADAVKQLEAKLKRMEKQVVDAFKERDDIAGMHRSALQKAMLAEALSAHEFIDRDVVESFVSARLEWEGGDLLYRDGETLVSVKDGVAGLAKAKPTLLKSAGAGGAGVRLGAGGSGQRNPWSKDTFNLTEQGRMLRENPQLAKQMSESAAR